MRRGCALSVVALSIVAGAGGGCSTKWQARFAAPRHAAALEAHAPFIKAHLADGSVYVLQRWRIASGHLFGEGILYDADRRVRREGSHDVALARVVLLETNRPKEVSHVGLVVLGVVSGASLAVTAACIASPKSCFGSCPTFYAASAGGGERLMAEGFSASITRRLEERDVDALVGARPRGRAFSLLMTNEALETHALRRLQLIAVERAPGYERVLRIGRGSGGSARDERYLAARQLAAPTRCFAARGRSARTRAPRRDCRELVRAFDREELVSLADARDLARREHIDVTFAAPQAGDAGRRALVIVARNSLLNTFLFYQAMAYMGRRAGEWLTKLDRAPRAAVDLVSQLGRDIGPIVVSLHDGKGWRRVGSAFETGPLAPQTHVVALPTRLPPGPVRVRLELTRGYWKIDQLALAELGPTLVPRTLEVARVTRRRGGRVDAAALARLRDPRRYLVTYPRDAYRLHFELPARPEQQALFLASTGYYVEWMRERWLPEQSEAKLTELLLHSGKALKKLAPRYKQLEPHIERIFWQSRLGREGTR